jgi:Uma2 family endonuclease
MAEGRNVMESTTPNPVHWTTNNLAIFEGDRVNRYEIIDGELFVTRASDWRHQAICINIGTLLKLWSDESGLNQTNLVKLRMRLKEGSVK